MPGFRFVLQNPGRHPDHRDGRGHPRADGVFRLPDRARHRAADVAAVHRPLGRRLLGDHQGPRAAGHPLRHQERRRHRAGAEGADPAPAHEARRGRPAQGRRRRLRDLRQVGRARRHQLRAEHQSSARAGGRAVAHHPRHRPRAAGPRPPRAAGTPAVLARKGRALGLDRAQGARHAGSAAGARHPPSHRQRGQRTEAAAGVGGGRDRPAAGRRQRRRFRRRRHRRRTQAHLRAPHARAGRIDRHLGGRPGPRPRAAHRRIRFQPHHPDLGQVRSRRPRGALEPDPRRDHGERRSHRRIGFGRQRAARRQRPPRRAPQAAARPEPQDRGNRQLRDFAHHQDRGDRGRPRQSRLGRGRGRRHLRQERQGRAHLSAARQGRDRPHRRAGAHRHRLRPEARRPGRGRQPAARRNAQPFRSASPRAG